MQMVKLLSVYYEDHGVSQKYFQEKMKQVGKIFGTEKISYKSIGAADGETLSYSHYPRVVLTGNEIRANNGNVILDGIGFDRHNLAFVKYQEEGIDCTMYLVTHELGHVFGLAHCQSNKCIMGVYCRDGRIKNSWRDVANSRQLSKKVFCPTCQKNLILH